jgi:hypothetical protein
MKKVLFVALVALFSIPAFSQDATYVPPGDLDNFIHNFSKIKNDSIQVLTTGTSTVLLGTSLHKYNVFIQARSNDLVYKTTAQKAYQPHWTLLKKDEWHSFSGTTQIDTVFAQARGGTAQLIIEWSEY